MAAEVASGVADRATIDADPPLREQHRARGRELDQDGDCSHQWQGEHQGQRRNHDVENASGRVATLRSEVGGPGEREQLRKCHAPITRKACAVCDVRFRCDVARAPRLLDARHARHGAARGSR